MALLAPPSLATTPLTTSPTAAHLAAHDHWAAGGWWPLFPILWFVLWAGVVTVVVLVVRRHGATRSGQAVLAERYARGEIGETEYADRLAVLRRRRRDSA